MPTMTGTQGAQGLARTVQNLDSREDTRSSSYVTMNPDYPHLHLSLPNIRSSAKSTCLEIPIKLTMEENKYLVSTLLK